MSIPWTATRHSSLRDADLKEVEVDLFGVRIFLFTDAVEEMFDVDDDAQEPVELLIIRGLQVRNVRLCTDRHLFLKWKKTLDKIGRITFTTNFVGM